jgi:carboxymethylenebutenolidase
LQDIFVFIKDILCILNILLLLTNHMEELMNKNKSQVVAITMILSIMIFATAVSSANTAMGQTAVNTIKINNDSDNDTSAQENIVQPNGTITLSNISTPLHRDNVIYYENTSGYLVYPEVNSSQENNSRQKLPAVVMIHEWWGLNDNMKNMADELAKEGYIVLAVDLYNGKVADTPDAAMKLVNTARSNQNESTSNLLAAVNYLKTQNNVDKTKIASLGWCFGGGQSLQLALNTNPQNPLAATVLYYGNLVTDEKTLSAIKWPVLGIFGSLDQSIPVFQVQSFKKALDADNITNEIYIYEGVGHAFANPTGGSFAPAELKDAWNKTLDFLEQHVKNK